MLATGAASLDGHDAPGLELCTSQGQRFRASGRCVASARGPAVRGIYSHELPCFNAAAEMSPGRATERFFVKDYVFA